MSVVTLRRGYRSIASATPGSRLLSVLLALALMVPAGIVAPDQAGAVGATTCVTVSTGGAPGDDESHNPAISPGGRYVVFESRATDLVAGGTDGTLHIFWRDRDTGATELISKSTGGVRANSNSFNATVSADGRYVAFESVATNLVASDLNGYRDVFVRDRQTSTTTRVSVATGTPGTQSNAPSENPVISADGRFVAFDSSATNLVSGDGNKFNDVFLRELASNITTRVSLTNAGAQATGGGSSHPSVSADGRYVAFQSRATNLVSVAANGYTQIYVRDRTGTSTTRMSVTGTSTQGNSDSKHPAISGNGLVVAFETFSTNLGGSNSAAPLDVIVREGASTTRVNRSSSGVLGNGVSQRPSLSHAGRYVAFDSSSTNLVGGDAHGKDDVFVRDRTAGSTSLVSVSSGGSQGDGHSTSGAISSDGLTVAFQSLATNLVGGDTNGKLDVFVNARTEAPTGTLLTISRSAYAPEHGANVTLYASLVRAYGLGGLGGMTVIFDRQTGPTTWVEIGRQTTYSNGSAKISFRPHNDARGMYRARFESGSTGYNRAVSSSIGVTPRPRLTDPVIGPTTVRRNAQVTVTGYLSPLHTVGSSPVRVYRQYNVNGTWRNAGYVSAPVSSFSPWTQKYTVDISFPYTGEWRVRSYAPIDDLHHDKWSDGYDYVTVN